MINKNKKFPNLIMPYFKEHPNFESIKAEALFHRFVEKGFLYKEISDRPEYMNYASSEILLIILPIIIDEMLSQKDTDNYLIYHVIAAIDPTGDGSSLLSERFHKMKPLIEKSTVEKICLLIDTIKNDPPVPIERIEMISSFWGCN
jgi:hypothetical protein